MSNIRRFIKFLACGFVAFFAIQPSHSAILGSCGPDATRGLEQMLDTIEVFFRAQPAHEQDSLCQGLYAMGYYSQLKYEFGFEYFDIRELRVGASDRGHWHFSNSNYHCEDTVQIQINGQNRCFHAWAVNYASWGMMNRLCHEVSPRYSEESAELMETAYKDIVYFGEGLKESEYWTTIGYSYTDAGTKAISESREPSRYDIVESCPLDREKGDIPTPFHFHWGPHQFSSTDWK